jgi:Na+-driven multidrug efflux pump
MVTMVAGMMVNIALDPLFIFALGWGVRGAALATILGRSVTAGLALRFYLRGRSSVRPRASDLLPRPRILWQTITIGLSAFVRSIGSSLAAALRNNLIVAYGGDALVAAFGAVFRVVVFLGMPGMGIAQAVQPIAGYNYGAGRIDRVRRSLWVSVGACTLFMTIGFAVTMIFPRTLLRVFSSEGSLVAEGVAIMRISSFLLLTFPAYIIAPSFYQALGKPASALTLSLARPLLAIVAMIVGARVVGALGIVAADPIAVAIGATVALVFLRFSLRNLRSPRDREETS